MQHQTSFLRPQLATKSCSSLDPQPSCGLLWDPFYWGPCREIVKHNPLQSTSPLAAGTTGPIIICCFVALSDVLANVLTELLRAFSMSKELDTHFVLASSLAHLPHLLEPPASFTSGVTPPPAAVSALHCLRIVFNKNICFVKSLENHDNICQRKVVKVEAKRENCERQTALAP